MGSSVKPKKKKVEPELTQEPKKDQRKKKFESMNIRLQEIIKRRKEG